MKVLKFGGSSVGTPDRIKSIIEILKAYYSEGEKFTVVFLPSAALPTCSST
jgi:aspartokinase/homoserine dehydrogenase 1